MASLFPAELDLSAITGQVEQLAQLLSDVAAERSVLPPFMYLLHLTHIPTGTRLHCESCWPICAVKLA
jgi:hypothetical protein